jgi:hypothetical protein
MASTFHSQSSVSWRWRTFRVTSTSKTAENVETQPRRPSLNNPWARRHGWDQLWSFPGDVNRKSEHERAHDAKFVPWLMTNDQKHQCVNECPELWEKANKDPTFISRIMMGNKSWIYSYSERKQQMSQWNSPQSPRAKKSRQVRGSTKSMLIVFFQCEGDCSRWIWSS